MPPRVFTLEQARHALTVIRPLMREIQSLRRSVLERRPELWPALERAAGNGGSAQLSALAAEFDRLDQLVHEILETGAEIKDLSSGLVDFRARRRDRAVYLCWKFDEADIAHWHEIDAGFAGRRGIDTF